LTIQVLLVFPYVCLPRWVSWMFKSISPQLQFPWCPSIVIKSSAES
jgi:hypothetical protein